GYRHRRNIAWHMKSVTVTTSLLLFGSIHGRIGSGETVLTGNESFPSGARSHRVIADGQLSVFFSDTIGPGGHGCLLQGCATTDEIARRCRGCVVVGIIRRTRRQSHHGNRVDVSTAIKTCELHWVFPLSSS